MAILTTSQLTFVDMKDAYHIEINPDYIIVNCDEKYMSKDDIQVSISYGVYCGDNRISGGAEVQDSQFTANIQDCTSDTDGAITFTIPANTDFSVLDSLHVVFSEKNSGDEDTYTFDKYIQFIKAVEGASGTGLVFKIYSEDGIVFREDMDQINLETVVFVGESRVDPSNITSYIWQWRESALSDWVNITDESVDTITVNKDDEWAFKTIRCVIEYNGNFYEDYISLTDDIVIYTSEVRYLNDTNVLAGTDKYLIAYMALYKNGEEIDLLPTNQCVAAESVDDSDIITTDVEKEDGTAFTIDDAGYLLYFVIPDASSINVYNLVLGRFDGTSWNVVQTEDVVGSSYECLYENSKAYNNLARSVGNEVNKIMVVSKTEVNKSLAISFKAYKKTTGAQVSEAIGNIIDANDPIISKDEPDDPANGQLWLDISVTPHVLKICRYKLENENKVIEWIESNQQIGGKVYTSKPSSYSINDVWILGDGETCSYSKEQIPEEYTRLEYIESSGTQYINTNYAPTTDNLKINLKFMYTSLGSWKALCGSGNAADTQWSLIPITNDSSNLTFYTGTSSQLGSLSVAVNQIYSLSACAQNNMLSYTLNETSATADFEGSIYKENSLYIFTHNSGDSSLTTSLACSARVYEFQIYDNDILVRDFVPCVDPNGIIGLYDTVHDVFYSNIGAGNFIAGAEITNVTIQYGSGSMLRASSSRTKEEGFVESDWSDIDPKLTEMRDNIAQYFQFDAENGLIIGQQDQKFYVNLTATEMGFYDNSNSDDPHRKVVSIGNQTATIRHLTVEEQTSFNCNSQANFNSDINIYNPYEEDKVGFVWKIEANGSLSLVVI